MPEFEPERVTDLSAETDSEGEEEAPRPEIKFAHASEKVCAEILDFYGITWLYEPKTFPLRWDKKGNIIQSFTPDFYLPELDLYIELTTMSQKLVTKKNRKVRQLRELYPDVNIKIFYQKDFRNLLLKYGLHEKRRDILPED
jgi:hypoxanthine phosphoribosyltransferase